MASQERTRDRTCEEHEIDRCSGIEETRELGSRVVLSSPIAMRCGRLRNITRWNLGKAHRVISLSKLESELGQRWERHNQAIHE